MTSIDTATKAARRPGDRVGRVGCEYREVRALTDRLAAVLSDEDCCIQSMPDASPARWHVAHTTWFFETFVLSQYPGYRLFNSRYGQLFNSYYNAVGRQYPRARRGVISRPGVAEVRQYRSYVDDHLLDFLASSDPSDAGLDVIALGLQHEQQHQELLLTDIKHGFSCNPLWPVYRPGTFEAAPSHSGQWLAFDEGVYPIGHAGDGFSYDNERPRHRVFLEPFELASQLVTCGQWLEFMADGGYQRPELWLSDGWQQRCQQGWEAPLYWMKSESGSWQMYTLCGMLDVQPHLPVCHVSYFEADAFARWSGCALPTEQQWEAAVELQRLDSQHSVWVDDLLDRELAIHPGAGFAGPAPALNAPALSAPALNAPALSDAYGVVWQWTSSPYVGYPGYRAPEGALGEYNGKFMCNQFVLRGGSCATPRGHMRRTYRNFFPPEARWQFSGLRLARPITG